MRAFAWLVSASLPCCLGSCAALDSWDGFSGAARADAGVDAGRPLAAVQGNTSSGEPSQASVTVPFTQPQLAGDLNVIAVGWYDLTSTVTAVTDTRGNHYRLAAGPATEPGADPISQSIYYASNIAAAEANANVLTVTWSAAASYPDVRTAEYAGLDSADPFDVTTVTTGDGGEAATGPVRTRFGVELLVGAAMVGGTVASVTGTGATFDARVISPNGNLLEDRFVTSLDGYAATAPLAPAAPWLIQLATFH